MTLHLHVRLRKHVLKYCVSSWKLYSKRAWKYWAEL